MLPLLLWWLSASPPSAEALQSAWGAVQPALRAHARLPTPSFTAAQWQALAAGEVVRQRVPTTDGVDRAVGAAWLPHSIDAIWIGVLDDVHDDLVSGLSETWLPGSTSELKRLYQHLDLPAPFSDRHWVIRITSTRALYEASGGAVWERSWDLDPAGPAALAELPAEFLAGPDAPELEGAVWTPVNEGGWTLVPAAGGVLVLYQVRTVIGGNIPDEVVLRYALSTLDELVLHVGELAARAPQHYRAGHYVVRRPDQSPIAAWP